jgi:hypothetical protein
MMFSCSIEIRGGPTTLELDIGPGRLQAHSANEKRLLTRERNRLHDRHRAPLGAGGLEGSAS